MSVALATRTLTNVSPGSVSELDGREVIVYAGFQVQFGEVEVQATDDSALLIVRSGDRGQPARIDLADVDMIEVPTQRQA